MFKYLSLIFIGIFLQLTVANIEESLQNLNIAGINDLPGNITSKIPSEGEIEEVFIKKCEKHGGPDAGQKITEAKTEVVECIKSLVDINEFQEEMERAKPTGDLDSIFKKYCKKSPDFKNCVSNFTVAFQPCLEQEEKSSVATIMNVTEQLTEFICYREGDRIALFIAEGGPECLESSKEAIGECVQTIYKKHLPKSENVSLSDLSSNIPLLLFQVEQCESFHKFQKCVVEKLETCKEPTAANIIDSLFTFIKRATPCASYKFVDPPTELNAPSGSSISFNFTSSTFFILAGLSALKFFF